MITDIDFSILHFIQEHLRCSFLDTIMPPITYFANKGIGWILIGAFLAIFIKSYQKTGLVMILGMLIGVIIGNLILKNLIARDRPCWIDESVILLIATPNDYSFPSGHTLCSVISATVLMYRDKRIGIPAIVFACIIAFSRLYLYVHFPTDILGAAILGIIIAITVCKITDKTRFSIKAEAAE